MARSLHPPLESLHSWRERAEQISKVTFIAPRVNSSAMETERIDGEVRIFDSGRRCQHSLFWGNAGPRPTSGNTAYDAALLSFSGKRLKLYRYIARSGANSIDECQDVLGLKKFYMLVTQYAKLLNWNLADFESDYTDRFVKNRKKDANSSRGQARRQRARERANARRPNALRPALRPPPSLPPQVNPFSLVVPPAPSLVELTMNRSQESAAPAIVALTSVNTNPEADGVVSNVSIAGAGNIFSQSPVVNLNSMSNLSASLEAPSVYPESIVVDDDSDDDGPLSRSYRPPSRQIPPQLIPVSAPVDIVQDTMELKDDCTFRFGETVNLHCGSEECGVGKYMGKASMYGISSTNDSLCVVQVLNLSPLAQRLPITLDCRILSATNCHWMTNLELPAMCGWEMHMLTSRD